jgi:hypothetical protein
VTGPRPGQYPVLLTGIVRIMKLYCVLAEDGR